MPAIFINPSNDEHQQLLKKLDIQNQNRLNDDNIQSKDGNIWYDGSLYNMMRGYI